MIVQSMPYPKGPAAPVTPYTMAQVVALFTAGVLGAAYDFTDGTKLAINADGTGGSPAVGAVVRWAVDQSPNANHLRNTLASGLPVRRINGVESSGTTVALFNTAGFGNWPNIPEPYEVIGRMEQLTNLVNGRLLALSDAATPALVQGPASGDIRFQTGAATVVPLSPGLNVEFTVGGAFSSGGRTQSLNGGTPIETGLAAAGVSALHFGSDNAGNSAPVIRFKRVLIIGRALTSTERAGINGWAAA